MRSYGWIDRREPYFAGIDDRIMAGGDQAEGDLTPHVIEHQRDQTACGISLAGVWTIAARPLDWFNDPCRKCLDAIERERQADSFRDVDKKLVDAQVRAGLGRQRRARRKR